MTQTTAAGARTAWTSVLQTGGNRFIIRDDRRRDVASIPTKIDDAAKYVERIVRAVNGFPDLAAALTEIEAMPMSMVNDADSLRHTIKTMQYIARAALAKTGGA